jgi:hypothetical protein
MPNCNFESLVQQKVFSPGTCGSPSTRRKTPPLFKLLLALVPPTSLIIFSTSGNMLDDPDGDALLHGRWHMHGKFWFRNSNL